MVEGLFDYDYVGVFHFSHNLSFYQVVSVDSVNDVNRCILGHLFELCDQFGDRHGDGIIA